MDLESVEREMSLEQQAQELHARLVEPLGLDRWTTRLVVDGVGEARAACESQPEYREAEISIDFNRLKTGDELAELMVHEMTHCHIEPLAELAQDLADTIAASAPEHAKEALKHLLTERVRYLEEQVVTDVGHVFLKLLRRAQVLDTPINQQEIDALPF